MTMIPFKRDIRRRQRPTHDNAPDGGGEMQGGGGT